MSRGACHGRLGFGRWAAGVLGCVALTTGSGSLAADVTLAPSLLRPATGALTARGAAMLARLEAKPTIGRARVAALDRAAFDGSRVRLALFSDVELEAERSDIGFTGVEGRSWTGMVADGGSAAFVIRGDRIFGSIATARGNFQILPLGDGASAVVEQDASALPECGTDRVGRPAVQAGPRPPVRNQRDVLGPARGRRALAGQGEARLLDTPGENRVRVLVAYTPGAKALTASNLGLTMQELVDLAVLESNQGYANSGVSMRIELAYLHETQFDESAAIENDLVWFWADGDGFMDEVHALRDEYDADMCSLIVDGTDPDWCGIAFGFDHTDYYNMFQATVYSCATGNFTFAHEFGHNQGCRHDNDGTLAPFAYGHGFRNGNSWRTIMALAGSSSAPRLNRWSNPDLNSPVSPFTAMGTAINGANFANDCRSALNAGDDIVVNHEQTPVDSTAPTGGSIGNDEAADKLVTGALSVSSFTADSGSRVQFRAGTAITLGTGFWARSGSSFRARLAGPLGDPPPPAAFSTGLGASAPAAPTVPESAR